MNTLVSTSPGARARHMASLVTPCLTALLLLLLGLAFAAKPARATDMTVYTDSLQNGWQDWSWTAHNLANTSPVQAGSDSIAVTFGAYQGLYFAHSAFDTTSYVALTFWIDGGATGGQRFNVQALNSSNAPYPGVPITNYVPGGAIPANQWVEVTIPLTDLGVSDTSNFGGFWFQDSTGGTQPTFYVDTLTLAGQAAPTIVHVDVNAAEALQTVDSRDFGVNTVSWDGNLDSANTQTLLNAAGIGSLRFPGGSWSDGYDFTKADWSGIPMTPQYTDLVAKTGAQGFITANYGSGTPQMAAAWVAYCNANANSTVALGVDSTGRNWQTAGYWGALRGASPISPDDGLNVLRAAHAAPFGIKYWELGNECYGNWENDTHSSKQDPVIYANFAQSATALMKQVDPTIQTGIVVTAGEDDWGNQTETVTNPVTGVQHKGWTAVLYATLKSLNFAPDFVIFHNYAQNPGGESDSGLLQSASSWTAYAQSIRTMLTQYIGSPSSGTQLICTENNSVSSNPGKQSVSLVNGLYCADSVGSLLQTEFHGLIWWADRNSVSTSGNLASSLYGWRQFGDYGIVASGGGSLAGSATDTPYPTYYSLKLLAQFARGGDTIVPATSDYASLSAYACKRANGDLSLLIINKNPGSSMNASIALTGYMPSGTATVYQYGEAQDTAQSTGASVDLAQSSLSGVASAFSATFPAYSMTVLTLSPANNATHYAINCGGPATGAFAADGYYSGTTVLAHTTLAIDLSAVTNPAPQSVYQTNRQSAGTLTYAFPGLTAGASYTVRLHFAELSAMKATGRLFNVALNGQTVLSKFDVVATAGATHKAVAETFTATADANGMVTITATSVKNRAFISGIEVTPN